MVVSYFMLTASRLPIPPWPLIFGAIAGVQDERKRTIAMRLFIACTVVAGTRLLVSDAIATSRMGITFWDQTDIPDDILFTLYAFIGATFSISLCLLTQIRTKSMHSASLVLNSFTIAVPIIGVLWGLTWIPGMTTGSVRYEATDDKGLAAVIFYVTFAAFLKLIIVATTVEFIKAGRVFDYIGISATAYLVFPMITTGNSEGIMPFTSILGMILVIFGICAAFFNVLFGLPPVFEVPSSRLDMLCKECSRTKTWFGCMHSPLFWIHRANRSSFPDSAVDMDVEFDIKTDTEGDDEEAHELNFGRAERPRHTTTNTHTIKETTVLGARHSSERNMFEIEEVDPLSPPSTMGPLSAF